MKKKRGEIMAEFKDRLKELRLNTHMTQKDLGQALGISSSTVGMYEQGNALRTMKRWKPLQIFLMLIQII